MPIEPDLSHAAREYFGACRPASPKIVAKPRIISAPSHCTGLRPDNRMARSKRMNFGRDANQWESFHDDWAGRILERGPDVVVPRNAAPSQT